MNHTNSEDKSFRKAYRSHIFVILVTFSILLGLKFLIYFWNSALVLSKVASINKILDNTAYFIIAELIVTAIVLLIFILREKGKEARIIHEGAYNEYSELAEIARHVGLCYFNPNSTIDNKHKSNAYLTENTKDIHTLRIVCATGWDTFGKFGSPLYKAVRESKRVEVVLMNPTKERFIEERAKHVNMTPEVFCKEIYDSIDYLATLMGKEKELTVRMYGSYPVWKTIFLGDRIAWLQEYSTNGHVQDSPCFAFLNIENGLYNLLDNQYIHHCSGRYQTYEFAQDVIIFRKRYRGQGYNKKDTVARPIPFNAVLC